MNTQGLRSPAILAAQKNADQAYDEAQAALKEASQKQEALQKLVDAYWDENLKKFDLNNPEDFIVVADAGWDNGAGNQKISDYIREWLGSKHSLLYSNSWWSNDKNTIFLPQIELQVTEKMNENDIFKLAEALKEIFSVTEEIDLEYGLNIPQKGTWVPITISPTDEFMYTVISSSGVYETSSLESAIVFALSKAEVLY